MWEKLLNSLPVAARSPSAVLLYICLLSAYLFFAVKNYRLKKISASLALIPENERAALLGKEYSTFPRSGLSANQWLRAQRQLFIFLAFIATLIAGLVLAIIAYNVAGQSPNANISDGEVALRFVYPQSPCLIVVNPSNSIIRDAKWAVAVWNVNLPDRNDPLPIPVSTFEWVKPHDESGPENLFDTTLVRSLLKPGDHLLGAASVNCPECLKGHSYLLDIVWGKGGTFAEIENETSGKLRIPAKFTKPYREAYFPGLETIPTKSRITIGER